MRGITFLAVLAFGVTLSLTGVQQAESDGRDAYQGTEATELDMPSQRGNAESIDEIRRVVTDSSAQGFAYLEAGNFEGALISFETSLAAAQGLEEPAVEIIILTAIGQARGELVYYERAIEAFQQVLAIARSRADRNAEAYTMGNLGTVYMLQSDRESAIQYYTRALQLHTQLGDLRGQAQDLKLLASNLAARGDYLRLSCDFLERRPYIDHGVTHPSAKNVN